MLAGDIDVPIAGLGISDDNNYYANGYRALTRGHDTSQDGVNKITHTHSYFAYFETLVWSV